MGLNIALLLLGMGSLSIIALMALGQVLMYRSSGVVNFSTGGIGMACSYLMWDLTRQAGWPPLPAGVVCVVVGGLLGLVTYVLVMVLPRANSNLTRVIGTLAVLIVLESAVQLRYGVNPLAVDNYLPQGSVDFGGEVVVPSSRILLLLVAVVLSSALAAFYSRSTFGLATTAASEHERKLAAFGWRIGVVGSLNWSLGGALAGLAGVLLAPIIGVAIGNGHSLTVTVLAAALIGGLRSFPLTLVGGMAIGMMQSLFGIHNLGVTGLADAVPFVAIIGVLIVRGRRLPLRSFVGERLPLVGSGTVRAVWVIFAAMVGIALIGPVLNDNGAAALTTSLLAAIPLLSLTVVLGYAGQMSLAQITLSGVGGLIAAQLVSQLSVPFPLALIVAVVATVPVGLVVGLPSARTRGVSLAVATLGLAVAIESLVFRSERLAGGRRGLTLSEGASFRIFGVEFDSLGHPDRFAYLVLGFVVLLALAVANLRRSGSGLRMIAVRGNERAAAGLGINVAATKLSAFGVAAGIAATGGVLTTFRGSVGLFTTYSVLGNVNAIGNAVIGGVGSVVGALFGATLEPAGLGNAALTSVLGLGPVTMGLLGGLLLIVTIITSPDGMAIAAGGSVRPVVRRAATFGRSRDARPGPSRSIARASEDRIDGSNRRPAGAATLTVRGMAVSFGGVRALDTVDLHVAPGEILGVIGANGAGKTTLIDSITGFVRCAGTVKLGEVELANATPHARARAGMRRSWQSVEMIEDLSVYDNLIVACGEPRWWSTIADLLRPRTAKPTAALARAIEMFDLIDVLDSTPRALSTGKRKLIAIARAIASEPTVLLLDEPCSGLDQHERDEVSAVVRTLATEWGMGVLLIEHDVDLVRRVSDRMVALDFGRVIAEGSPEEVLSNELVIAAFLGGAVGEVVS